ncbi:hypothetical protein ACXZ9C_11105 [Streptococcus agalactiae]
MAGRRWLSVAWRSRSVSRRRVVAWLEFGVASGGVGWRACVRRVGGVASRRSWRRVASR